MDLVGGDEDRDRRRCGVQWRPPMRRSGGSVDIGVAAFPVGLVVPLDR
jgi:hypothetical protein